MFFTKTAGRHNLVEVVLKVFRPSYLEKTTNNLTLNGGRGRGGVGGVCIISGIGAPGSRGEDCPFNGLKCRPEDSARKGNLFQASGICKPE